MDNIDSMKYSFEHSSSNYSKIHEVLPPTINDKEEISKELCKNIKEIIHDKFPPRPLMQATKTIQNEAIIYATDMKPVYSFKIEK